MRKVNIVSIVNQAETYVSAKVLADMLGVSERTIRNEIKELSYEVNATGVEFILKKSYGYYLKIVDEEKLRNYLKQVCIYDPKDRKKTELAFLLLQNDYSSQEKLAEMFDVSKSIIRRDMDELEDDLLKTGLILERTAHYGVRLKGTSYNKKILCITLLEEENLYLLEKLKRMDEGKINQVESKFVTILNNHNRTANYWDLTQLLLFLKATILIPPSLEAITDKQDECTLVAKDIVTQVESDLGIKTSGEMVDDLSIFLSHKTKKNVNQQLYNEDLVNNVKLWMLEIDELYQMDFSEDKEFMKSLLAHTDLLLERLFNHITFSNPLVKEISARYPVVFNIAIHFKELLEKEYGVQITNEEIGFIATHFATHLEKSMQLSVEGKKRIAILCSTGGGSAYLIKLKMERLFVNSIIETFALTQVQEAKNFNPDLVFSIQNIVDVFNVPVIQIHELLSDYDMLKIRDMFASDFHFSKAKILRSLIREDVFFIESKVANYQDLLYERALDLEEKGYSEIGYADQVMKREEVMPTLFDQGVAIPHPIEMCAIDQCVSVTIIKDENVDVKLMFLVNLYTNQVALHQELTAVILKIMEHKDLKKVLQNIHSFEEFCAFINPFMD